MNNEELATSIIELLHNNYCGDCNGEGSIATGVFNNITDYPEQRSCNSCDGTGEVPSNFARELTKKLKELSFIRK